MTTNQSKPIVSARDAIMSLRSSVYQSSEYAIAELVDNSVDSGANRVSLLIKGQQGRIYWVVDSLAVVDNGSGMSADELANAPRLGISTVRGRRNSLGRYGYGLLAASLSQCRRFEIYSWQNGIDSAIWTAVDLDEYEDLEQEALPTVPYPKPKSVPNIYLGLMCNNPEVIKGKSGTLVIWNKIDRISRKRVDILQKRVQPILGRIYRHMINNGDLSLNVAFDGKPDEFNKERVENRIISPNDPMYLMQNTQTPEPYQNVAMFEHYSDKIFPVCLESKEYSVKVEVTNAKEEAITFIEGTAPGAMPHGRHAAENIGISIVREQRELCMLPLALPVSTRDPKYRWIGVEVSFSKELDDFFGVGNTKQNAVALERALKECAQTSYSDDIEFLLNELEIDTADTTRKSLYTIADYVTNKARQAFRKIDSKMDQINKGIKRKAKTQTPEDTAEQMILAKNREEVKKYDDPKEKEEVIQRTEKRIKQFAPGQETEITKQIVEDRYPVKFDYRDVDSTAFFIGEELENGSMIVVINKRHKLYQHLDFLREQSDDSYVAILLMLYGYVKCERREEGKDQKNWAARIREHWGWNVNDAVAEFEPLLKDVFENNN